MQTQKKRLEAAWSKNRFWEYEDWKQNILEQPLMQMLSQKLIWEFDNGKKKQAGIYENGKIVNTQSKVLQLKDCQKVRLWHPVEAKVEEVKAWRDYIFDKEIQQKANKACLARR